MANPYRIAGQRAQHAQPLLSLDAPPPVHAPGQPTPAPPQPPATGPQRFTVYHDTAIPLWTTWDVPTAINALDQHALGNFFQSALLADAMGIDDAFDAVVQTRILGLVSRKPTLSLSPRGDRRKAKTALRDVSDRWSEIFPDAILASLMHAYLLMGFSPAQVLWHYDDELWIPGLQQWHCSSVYYDVARRSYVANAQEGPVYLAPGDGRWVLLTPFGDYRGWMHGAVRAVVIPFLARQYALRDWARYNEVHGLPIKLAKAPAKASGDDKRNFEGAIANLGNETTVLLPQGVGDKEGVASYDLDLLEATADTYAAFKDLVSKCEDRMAIRLLGQNLTSNIEAGSFAAANIHDGVRLEYVRADAKALGALREQVLRAFCMFNYGDPDVAPVIEWKITPPESNAARATAVSQLMTALVNAGQIQAPIDMREMLRRADIPLIEGVGPDVPTPREAAGDAPSPEKTKAPYEKNADKRSARRGRARKVA